MNRVLLPLLTGALLGGVPACFDGPQEGVPFGDLASGKISCPTRAYLLRGLWDYYSTGLNGLQDELLGAGVTAEAISGADWPNLLPRVVELYANQGATETLVLVGHSYGADDAIRMADYLEEYGLGVPLLVLIDATRPPPIPPNVDRCVHVYVPNVLGDEFPDGFAGNPVEAKAGNTHTEVVNIPVSSATFGEDAAEIGHLNIEAARAIHAFVMKELELHCEATSAP
ncbi:hypothetical protein RAS1_24600 [Phycisphaerae bacterium RAS1]|nr:hypothetical protein RAS1_24600 [Phycisphaerae bacterium RAS1]